MAEFKYITLVVCLIMPLFKVNLFMLAYHLLHIYGLSLIVKQ